MDRVSKDYNNKQQMRLLFFMLFGIPSFGISVGLAAYHFHWREMLLLKYTVSQINTALDVLMVSSAGVVVAVVSRRVVSQAKYRGR